MPLEEVPARVLALRVERADAVADAGHILMGQPFRLNSHAVESPRHDDEGAMAAFRRFVAESGVEIQCLAESRPAHDVHDAVVVLRSLRCKTVRPVVLQLVREVSARNEDSAPAGAVHRVADYHAQPVVVDQRLTGKADADDPAAVVFLSYKVQGHHRPVVEAPVLLTECSCREVLRIAQPADLIRELSVIGLAEPDLRRSESCKIPGRAFSRRYVKIVRIHHGMRTCDYYSLRPERRDLIRDLLIGLSCLSYLLFASPADVRNDHRRVRYHKTCNYSHSSLLI